MDYQEREHLKRQILSDLELLIDKSWDVEVIGKLQVAKRQLENTTLEGYDD